MVDFAQLAKDVQAILGNAAPCAVYEADAPRDDAGKAVAPPYAVYTAIVSDPQTESGVFTVDLTVDVWALNTWDAAYRAAQTLDNELDGTIYDAKSGTLLFDRNGIVFQRMERDPDDSRIRRMRSQYLIRFYPVN